MPLMVMMMATSKTAAMANREMMIALFLRLDALVFLFRAGGVAVLPAGLRWGCPAA
jgi:hypothetical protein